MGFLLPRRFVLGGKDLGFIDADAEPFDRGGEGLELFVNEFEAAIRDDPAAKPDRRAVAIVDQDQGNIGQQIFQRF